MSLSPDLIPDEWKKLLCDCLEVWFEVEQIPYPWRIFRDDGTNLFICVRCDKPIRTCIYKCINCSDIFLKDYSHPWWLLDWPKCWSCLEKLPPNEIRAAQIQVKKKQIKLKPQLRSRYMHITEGFDAASFFKF